MHITIDIFHHFPLSTAESKLDEILSRLKSIQRQETQMAKTLDDVKTQVAANTDTEQSAIQLLTQLHDLLVAAQGDPAKIDEIIASLSSSKEALAAAIVANTPAAPSA